MKVAPIFSAVDCDLSSVGWTSCGNSKYPKRSIRNDSAPPRQKLVYAHQIVMSRMIGRKLVYGELIDHINRDILDCRRENLRVTDFVGNRMNITRKSTWGVTYHKRNKRWQAQFGRKGTNAYIGSFLTFDEARDAALNKLQTANYAFTSDILAERRDSHGSRPKTRQSNAATASSIEVDGNGPLICSEGRSL